MPSPLVPLFTGTNYLTYTHTLEGENDLGWGAWLDLLFSQPVAVHHHHHHLPPVLHHCVPPVAWQGMATSGRNPRGRCRPRSC